jgi:hypothetical protein
MTHKTTPDSTTSALSAIDFSATSFTHPATVHKLQLTVGDEHFEASLHSIILLNPPKPGCLEDEGLTMMPQAEKGGNDTQTRGGKGRAASDLTSVQKSLSQHT